MQKGKGYLRIPSKVQSKESFHVEHHDNNHSQCHRKALVAVHFLLSLLAHTTASFLAKTISIGSPTQRHHNHKIHYKYQSNNKAKMTGTNGTNGNGAKIGTEKVKQGLAQMLKGGVIVSSFMSYMLCRFKWLFLFAWWGRRWMRMINTTPCRISRWLEKKPWAMVQLLLGREKLGLAVVTRMVQQ